MVVLLWVFRVDLHLSHSRSCWWHCHNIIPTVKVAIIGAIYLLYQLCKGDGVAAVVHLAKKSLACDRPQEQLRKIA